MPFGQCLITCGSFGRRCVPRPGRNDSIAPTPASKAVRRPGLRWRLTSIRSPAGLRAGSLLLGGGVVRYSITGDRKSRCHRQAPTHRHAGKRVVAANRPRLRWERRSRIRNRSSFHQSDANLADVGTGQGDEKLHRELCAAGGGLEKGKHPPSAAPAIQQRLLRTLHAITRRRPALRPVWRRAHDKIAPYIPAPCPSPLTALSPRWALCQKLEPLRADFSEFGRSATGSRCQWRGSRRSPRRPAEHAEVAPFPLRRWRNSMPVEGFAVWPVRWRSKEIERRTNHDVKDHVDYWRQRLAPETRRSCGPVHPFACTSEDISNSRADAAR